MYRTSLCGDRAIAWMVLLRPFMGARRKAKMDEVVTFRENRVMRKRRLDGLCPNCGERPRQLPKAYCTECGLDYFLQYNKLRG